MAFLVRSQDGKSAKHKTLFNEAIKYLKQSQLAKEILEDMQAYPAKIEVVISESKAWRNKYLKSKTGEPIVHWNPWQKLKTTYTKRDSIDTDGVVTEDLSNFIYPAVLLMHEIGHAFQLLSDPEGFDQQMKSFQDQVRKRMQQKGILQQEAMQQLKKERRIVLEETNVAAIENTVAMELRAKGYPEGLRWWYADNVMKATHQKFKKRLFPKPKSI